MNAEILKGSLSGESVTVVEMSQNEVVVKLKNGEIRVYEIDELKIQDHVEETL